MYWYDCWTKYLLRLRTCFCYFYVVTTEKKSKFCVGLHYKHLWLEWISITNVNNNKKEITEKSYIYSPFIFVIFLFYQILSPSYDPLFCLLTHFFFVAFFAFKYIWNLIRCLFPLYRVNIKKSKKQNYTITKRWEWDLEWPRLIVS